eukprot:COSAG05_NODE_667_length_8005_cov_4.987984_3_plen_174_part_00
MRVSSPHSSGSATQSPLTPGMVSTIAPTAAARVCGQISSCPCQYPPATCYYDGHARGAMVTPSSFSWPSLPCSHSRSRSCVSSCRGALGLLRQRQGRVPEAEVLYTEVLQAQIACTRPDHPDALKTTRRLTALRQVGHSPPLPPSPIHPPEIMLPCTTVLIVLLQLYIVVASY